MVITDVMPKMHGAKSSVVAHVRELRVPSPLPPSEVAMKAALEDLDALSEEEPETHRKPTEPPPRAMFDSDSDLVPVVHQHRSVRLYPASFPVTAQPRRETSSDVRPFDNFSSRMDDPLEPMRRIYTPQPIFPVSAHFVSESLMPQVIGLEIVTTPPPAPTSWRHRLAMAAIWAVVISTGGGAIGYSRGDFTKQDVRYTAACAQMAVADLAHVAHARIDPPKRPARTWSK